MEVVVTMRRLMAVLALVMLFTLPAGAQEPSQDSTRVAAASELVDVLELEQSHVPDMGGAMSGLTASNPMAGELAKLMTEFYQEFAPWDKVRPEVVRIYAGVYTESELREMIAFYRTPIGQKMIERTPELTKAMVQVTQKLLMPHMLELQQRMMSRFTGGGE